MKKIVLGISGGISFLAFLVLLFVSGHLADSQLPQTVAERWSSDGKASQVSCFFSVGSGITEDQLIEFRHTVDGALTDASVVQESENPGARLWTDAYSADGQVTLSNDKTNLTADAIGIGGDFFLFHPVTLLNGAYFSGNDLMQDYCVIDEDAAWQLFGSNDVAGMTVYISGIPHIVTGVVERPSGRLAEAAGLESTLVYVSYQTLTELGSSHGINHYEIVMPNPVTGFAYNYVKEKLGSEEKEVEVVENTTRYSIPSRLQLLGQFGTRSMNGKAIIYPYWENIARGYSDILALLTLFGIVFLLYPTVLALVFFCIWWKHKGWTMKDVWHRIQDFAERRMEKQQGKHGRGRTDDGWGGGPDAESGYREEDGIGTSQEAYEDSFRPSEDSSTEADSGEIYEADLDSHEDWTSEEESVESEGWIPEEDGPYGSNAWDLEEEETLDGCSAVTEDTDGHAAMAEESMEDGDSAPGEGIFLKSGEADGAEPERPHKKKLFGKKRGKKRKDGEEDT